MRRRFIAFFLVLILSAQTGPRLRAAENPALDILKVSAGVLAGIEAVHLLYLLVKKISLSRKKTETPAIAMTTNFPPAKSLETVAMPLLPFAPHDFNTNRFEIPVEIAVRTNPPVRLTNLTPSEQRDIELFGHDYYYLVGLQYDKVKKPEKAKEYLLHSLAIGMMMEESKAYLRTRFGMTESQIEQGIRMYKRPKK